MVNIIRTLKLGIYNYIDKDDPCKGILSAAAFAIPYIFLATDDKSPGQLVFGRDIILEITHVENWKSISQQKLALIYILKIEKIIPD